MAQLILQQATVSGAIRRETFDGREWLVVPVVAVVQGVLNGELVPADEIARSLPSWDGRPVTVGHPRDNVDYISANSPGVLEEWGAGYLFNCGFEDERLKGEMWLDLSKAARTGGNLAAAVARFEAGQTTEVSTGYWRDVQSRAGSWNGRPYTAVQANILPDHLAILLDAEGACNWDDGCGAPRVNAAHDCKCKEHHMRTVKVNVEISLDEQLSRVYDAFWQQFERADGMREVWPREVFGEVVIASNGTQLFAYPYTVAEDGAITFGEPSLVEIVYQDSETGQSVIGNAGKQAPQANVLARAFTALVSAVRGNTGGAAGKELEQIIEELEQPAPTSAGAGSDDPDTTAGDPSPNDADPGATGAEGDEIVPNQYTELIDRLGGPEAVERDILALRANNNAARQQCIARLTTNGRCAFTAEELTVWSDDALAKLERSLETADYGGRGLPRPHQDAEEEVMAMPAIPSRNGAGK